MAENFLEEQREMVIKLCEEGLRHTDYSGREIKINLGAEKTPVGCYTTAKWISVKDRLPEAGTKALCYLKRGEYWTAVWDDCGDDLWSDGEAWCSNGVVTHWMPLPQPPKGE